jgi:hypothetical protein
MEATFTPARDAAPALRAGGECGVERTPKVGVHSLAKVIDGLRLERPYVDDASIVDKNVRGPVRLTAPLTSPSQATCDRTSQTTLVSDPLGSEVDCPCRVQR